MMDWAFFVGVMVAGLLCVGIAAVLDKYRPLPPPKER
jgi:hypothetical protein